MRAAVHTRYGPPEVVRLVEAEDPTPGAGEVLVRVRAAGVASGDARMRGFDLPRKIFWVPGRLMMGIFRPRKRRMGTDFAGVVEAIGEGVTGYKPGDAVFGVVPFSGPQGSHVELVTVAADGLISLMPEGMGFEEAGCLCFGLLTARHFLQKEAGLKAGDRVLVVGASGAVGCAAVQLAKLEGAHVTGVCSAQNEELVRSLGAERTIDYKTARIAEAGGEYDIILDCVGATSFRECLPVLKEDGRFLAVVMGTTEVLQVLGQIVLKEKKGRRVIVGIASETPEDIAYIRGLAERGYRSVIDGVYPFEEIVEAHRRVDTGRKRGNVVVTIG